MLVGGRQADAEAVERFRAEAAAVARLRHPGIVSIHEVGRHEGHHWFSMDWVDGPSLAQLLADGLLEPRATVEILAAVAEAVEHAHQQGVLHRDLKPSNIVLDADGRPRVTDFGLTRRPGTDSEFTASGQVLGTPGYLPPEQAEGRRHPAGAAGDVYGLGATLYHLLTGQPPFAGPSLAATLKQVLHDEPINPANLNPRVNRDLATVCLKCLEKEPARRYQTARELAEELHRWLRHEPILARSASVFGRMSKWVRRQPIVAGALGAVLVIAALAAGLVTTARQRQARVESEVAGRWQRILAETESFGERDGPARGLSAWARLMRLNPQKPEPVRRVLELLSGQIQILKLAEPYKARVSGRDAAWSDDGRWMATGATNGRVFLFEADQMAEAAVFRAHSRAIRSLVFSPDGRHMLTTADDGTARWLTVPDGSGTFRWTARLGAHLSSDGAMVLTLGTASTNSFETAQVWSTVTGAPIGVPMPHTKRLTCGVFSRDNTKVFTGDELGTVRVFEAKNRAAVECRVGGRWTGRNDMSQPGWRTAGDPGRQSLRAGLEPDIR